MNHFMRVSCSIFLLVSLNSEVFASSLLKFSKNSLSIFKKIPAYSLILKHKPTGYRHVKTFIEFAPFSISVGAGIASVYYLYNKERVIEPKIQGQLRSIQALPGMDVYDMECGVRWLDDQERLIYEVRHRDGTLQNKDNEILHMKKPGIFIMTPSGEIFIYEYLISPMADRIRHSSLSLGMPVAAAGDIFVRNGKVTGLTNISGHYWPDLKLHQQIIDTFVKWNVFKPELMMSACSGGIIKHGKIFQTKDQV